MFIRDKKKQQQLIYEKERDRPSSRVILTEPPSEFAEGELLQVERGNGKAFRLDARSARSASAVQGDGA